MDTSRPCKPSRVRGHQCRCRGHRGPMAPRPRPPSVSPSSPPWTSPGLLHAVFRPKSDVRPVDLVAALDVEAEPAAFLGNPFLVAADIEDERVPRLIDDASTKMLLAGVRRRDHLDLEPDQLVLPQVHGVSSVADSFGVGAGAVPSRRSSDVSLRIRAMFSRRARIFRGFGGAPPIDATPRRSISSARESMISTVTPMTPGLSFAAAKPRSIQRLRGSPQYLM